MEASSPARLYCLLVGGVLVIAGIIGFFYEASFAAGDEVVADDVFGILAVNGWHNLVHIAIGALLLLAAGGAARSAALFVGALYLVLAILGFIATGDNGIGFVAENGVLIDLVPVNNEDNWLHVILGVTGILAGLASGRKVPAVAPST
ncbi:MAG TPA: DUF4383 domain-containing protein [Solirubrobacterales bacterium]|jgi:hypothetical protein|nr:DUF4383 domain-containing protein [Solirubrobacterales bacterium]